MYIEHFRILIETNRDFDQFHLIMLGAKGRFCPSKTSSNDREELKFEETSSLLRGRRAFTGVVRRNGLPLSRRRGCSHFRLRSTTTGSNKPTKAGTPPPVRAPLLCILSLYPAVSVLEQPFEISGKPLAKKCLRQTGRSAQHNGNRLANLDTHRNPPPQCRLRSCYRTNPLATVCSWKAVACDI